MAINMDAAEVFHIFRLKNYKNRERKS
jgi:hypothetical protein